MNNLELRLLFWFSMSLISITQLKAQCNYQAYYKLDGNAADSSGFQNHGTFFGGTLTAAPDRFNNPTGAVYFDGFNDYIETYTTYDFPERTVSVWIYPERVTGVNAAVAHDANSLTYGAFSVNMNNNVIRGRAGGSPIQDLITPVSPNTWYHVVLVRRTDSVFYYINGQLTASEQSNSLGSVWQAYDKMVIGSHRSRSQDFFKGRVDDLKIFDCAFDSTQVDSIYGITPVNPCIIGYWPFNGNTNDTTSNANHAVVFGGTAVYGTDRFGNPNGAYVFDGVDDYLNTFATYDYEERTVGFWFSADRTSNDILFGQDDNTLNYGGLSAGFSNGNLNGRAGGNGASTVINGVNLNTWYHVVMVRTTNMNYYYLNGQLVDSAASNTGGSSFQAYDKLIFGVHRSRNQRFFKGKLDDFFIGSCPMDSNEVDSVYQAQLPIPVPGLPNDTTLCPGDSLVINMPISPGINYLWDNNSTSNVRVLNQAGTYWLRSTSITDTLRDTIVLSYFDLPQTLKIDTALCAPATLTVDYSTNAADSLLWSDGSTSRQRSFSSSVSLSVNLYSLCGMVVDTVNIEIVNSLIPKIVDTTLCPGTSMDIGSRSATGYQFLWSTGATQNQISISAPGTYWSRAILPCDTVVDTFYVSSPALIPSPVIPDSLYLCEEGDSILIGISALDTSISFQWSNAHTSPNQWVSSGGIFNLSLDNGCDARTLKYEVIDLSELEPEPFEDTTLCLGQTIYHDFNQWPVNEIRINNSVLNDGLYQFNAPGIYNIQYAQPCGIWEDEFELDYEDCDCDLLMPNAFTPNGDGLNDLFAIKSACDNFDYDIEIFNRWGILIFQNDSPDDFWDGSFKGDPVPGGVFIYKITYTAEINGRSIKKFEQGTIRLYR